MIVQIYEIQSPREAERCIEAGVDHLGSVVLSQTDWKQPEIREVVRLSDGSRARSSIIPLFQEINTICRVLDYYKPDFIHFCESLTDNEGVEIDLEKFIRIQSDIKDKFPEIEIIRSIPIPTNGSALKFPTLKIARVLEPVSDLFLTDTWFEKGPVKGFIGITGNRCDWKIARELVIQSRIPVILAGGLSPENVYGALMDVHPAGADSCTLTNKKDNKGKPVRFLKDFTRVKRFVEEVRRADLIIKKGV
ncbi:hypothetical protein ACFLZG_03425 [Thermodesulfobacteriota bacterium]